MKKRLLVLCMTVALCLTLLPTLAFAAPGDPTTYTLNAVLAEDKGTSTYPGVYIAKAVPGAKKDTATLGIPSIAKQNLENGPTTESPAIITGAAVPYEVKVGPTDFQPIPGGSLYAPYSYFRYSIIEEPDPGGGPGTHKKMSGFDVTYVIIRVDVSDLIANAPEGSYLHVKQEGNKALLVAIGQNLSPGVATFVDSTGSKTGSYSLDNAAAVLKDASGDDKDTPYIDIILLSSGTIVAGADTGSTDPATPTADIGLSFYVDQVGDYNPGLIYDPTSTDPNHEKNVSAKYYDESKVSADAVTGYTVKGSDLELEVEVSDNTASGQKEFWSLRKAIAYQDYNNKIVKLICEVAGLQGILVQGTGAEARSVILDLNSFDFQLANHQETGAAALTVDNAELTIQDKSNTTGAELAVGNNASLLVKAGGRLIIDESCQLEVEYDAASITQTEGGTTPAAPNLTNGIITIEKDGEIVNNGVLTIEGTEGKPIDPAAPAQRDVRNAILEISEGGTLTNGGCLLINGQLYNKGTINNTGCYNDVIVSNDPDKGKYTYHKGIQLSWKDDITQNSGSTYSTYGTLYNGYVPSEDGDSAGTVYPDAAINNKGDIVLVPGYLVNSATLNNEVDGMIYLAAVDEAVIPITPTAAAPTVMEKRIQLDEPVFSSLFNRPGATLTNDGGIFAAEVKIVSNGRTGDLTTDDVTEEHLNLLSLVTMGPVTNTGVISLGSVDTFDTLSNLGDIDGAVVLRADADTALSGKLIDDGADKVSPVFNGIKAVRGNTWTWTWAGTPTLTVTPATQNGMAGDTVEWAVTARSEYATADTLYQLHVTQTSPSPPREVMHMTLDANQATRVNSPILPALNDNVIYEFSLNLQDVETPTASVAVTSFDVTPPSAIPDLVYNGKAQTLVTSGGAPAGETMVYSLDGEQFVTDIPTATQAGTYTIAYKLNGQAMELGTVTATIEPKPVTVSANNLSTKTGEALAELTWTVSGAADGDAYGTVSAACDADKDQAGTYPITLSLTDESPNFNVTLNDGVYTVTDAAFTVTVKDKYAVYDGTTTSAVSPDLTVTGTATAYYSETTELTDANYKTAGVTTAPVIGKPGTSIVYYYVTDETDAISGMARVIIANGDQKAPEKKAAGATTGLDVVAESVQGSGDGQITGLTPYKMEYRRADNDGTYTTAYYGQAFVPAGTYLVRMAADVGLNPSPDTELVVPAGPALTVTFDGNNGTPVTEVTGLSYGDRIPQPANPVYEGYTFMGWYYGDEVFDFSTPVTHNTTLIAHWREAGGGGGGGGGGGSGSGSSSSATNPVSTGTSEGGSVKANAANAKAGDTVTITVTPDEGYQVEKINVVDKNGNVIPVTQNANGTYSFTMPNTPVTITPTFEKIADQPGTDVSDRFSDVARDAWYHDAVQWAVDKGIMNGVAPDLFDPDGTATRAMVVTMLWRLAGEPAAAGSDFSDVTGDSWYADAVAWAASTGAVNGMSADTFAPDTEITREQLATILYRYAQSQGKGFTGAWAFPLNYPDAGDVSDWAYEAMCWMTMNGIIQGMDDGTLDPGANATRAQIATMFQRFDEALNK